MILKTERLLLRRMTEADFAALCAILQDREVMYAYEHAFSDEEAHMWLDRQIWRYHAHGFGLWAAVRRDTGQLIGQCGITMQEWAGRQVPEIGYLFRQDSWHHGYAIEAARACREYAFRELGMPMVYSIIRENNYPSQRVALRNGMSLRGRMVKHYYHMDMPHLVFGVARPADAWR